MGIGKIIEATGTKITVEYDPDQGLTKALPNIKTKIKELDPLLKPIIEKFNKATGRIDFEDQKKRIAELYKESVELDEKIVELGKRLMKSAVSIKTGKMKRSSYEKMEADLTGLKKEKIICLTAEKELIEMQKAYKKEAIKSVSKIAREEYKPVIQEWDRILKKIEALKVTEKRIRIAFTVATGIGEDSGQYGYLPGVPRVNVDDILWREDVKRFLR